MKVLVFIERSEPSRYWASAVPMLKEKGIQASFATLRPAGLLTEAIRAKGIETFELRAESSKGYPVAVMWLASIVRSGRYDIVHSCESIPAAIAGFSRFVAPGPIRLFHRQHNANPQRTRLFHTLANRLSDKIMTCSAFTKEFAVREDGVPKGKVRVAYNGIIPLRDVPAAEVEGIRHRLGIPPNAKVISIVARLSEEKGHLTLIEASRIAARSVAEPVHLVMTGDGDLGPALREAAEKAEDITVHFAGRQEDVAPWFAVGDVIAMPSYTEAFGISAVEAMSSGRPLIASGVGGLLEVVEHGVSGLHVPPADPQELAKALIEVLSSPELAESLSAGGQKRVLERFTLEKMVDGWIDCYNWALSE